MSVSNPHKTDALAAQLPFHIDNVEAVNKVFSQWRALGQNSDKRLVDLWTYCFIRRYFSIKFMKDATLDVTELDQLVGKIFTKICQSQEKVREEDKYASWVSVICKNHFINHLRGRKRIVAVEYSMISLADDRVHEPIYDLAIVYQAVVAAIGRLPAYLQEAARLRIIEEESYEEIGKRLGKKVQVVRSYVHKALVRLREDPALITFVEPEAANQEMNPSTVTH